MNRAGIIYYPSRHDSAQLAERARTLLQAGNVSVWQGSVDDEASLREAAPGLDLLITLGGDGTIVRAVRATAPWGIPLLGVNLGRLGFLAEVEPQDIETALHQVLDGQYQIEKRMMLRAELRRHHELLVAAEAINDVVVGRGGAVRTVEVSVHVDSHYVMTQVADALVVSTPTGSTAYCLSAGGPIVAPDLDCITITPVAAHLSMAHAIVIPAHRRVSLHLLKGSNAVFNVDGQVDAELLPDDEVILVASDKTARFVRFGGDGYFYKTVLRRLRWPDRIQIL